jgi:iron uptake system EfeUOB component EfeO/EfeM
MPAPEGTTPGGTPKALGYAVPAAAVLALAGGVAFYAASQMRGPVSNPGAYPIAVTAKACEPNELTVPAGKRSFEIANRSDRPVEWEILDGVMVVAERENIAPGLKSTLDVRLQPGDYAITCGLLSNPRGALHVTAEGATDETGKTPDIRAFIGALSEYKVYLVLQSSAMVSAAQGLAEAIHAGNLDEARALYAAARLPYKRVEPVAYRFSDLANAVNPVAEYLAQREADPGFTGYHRLEYALFGRGDAADLPVMADKLAADLKALKDRLGGLKLGPADLAESAARTAEQLAEGRIAQGEDRYAGSDLSDIGGNLDGIAKLVGLLRPVIKGAAPDAMGEVDAKLAAATQALDALKQGDAWPAYDTVSADQRKALAGAFRALAQALDAVNAAIGIT